MKRFCFSACSQIVFLAIISSILLASCGVQSEKFNSDKWSQKDDIEYANREKMVIDLMENHLQKGMTYADVVCLLGAPDYYNCLGHKEMTYKIVDKYGWDTDPVGGKNLVIELSEDSLVRNITLDEW